MAQHLVYPHGNGVRKIQGPGRIVVEHGQPDTVGPISLEQFFRQPGCLLAENEIGLVGIGHIGIEVPAFGGEIIKGAAVFVKKIREIWIRRDIQKPPIVEARPLEMSVIDGKAERTHQMQVTAGRCAGAADVPRVLRYFRLN